MNKSECIEEIINNSRPQTEGRNEYDKFETVDKIILESMAFFSKLKINIKTKNDIFAITEKIVSEGNQLLKEMIRNSIQSNVYEIIDAYDDYIREKIKKHSTAPRREALAKKLPTYVKPIPCHISTYWDSRPKDSLVMLKESKFESVSIIET